MEIIAVIAIIVIVWKLQNNPNLLISFYTVIWTTMVIVVEVLGIIMTSSYNEILNQIPILYLVIIVLMIVPCFFLKNFWKNIINIIYYRINKEKILKDGKIEKGVIQKAECILRGFQDIYLLIAELNGKKIRSFYYLKNEYKYKVGDEIDVIVYKNWKYVKLYNMM